MHKLGFLDATFLYAETRSAPMNIGAVQLLELPAGVSAGPFFEELRRFVGRRVGQIPFMTRRLKQTPLMLDQPVWIGAQDFDVARHVQRVVLPSPGTKRQLEATVARLHETPLDRHHPLWTFYYIEGLDSAFAAKGRTVVGWYCKYHHACIDGMAGQGIIDVLFSEAPHVASPILPTPPPELEPTSADLLVDAGRNVLARSLTLAGQAAEQWRAWSALSQRVMGGVQTLGAIAEQAPRTPFNVAVGPYRAWSMATLPLGTMRALAKSLHVTLNDIVLATCSAGLRTYLARAGGLPDASLIAGVPVSLRERGDKDMRNRVGMMLASLASDVADPLARLMAIKQSTRVGKSLLAETRALQVEDVHVPGLPLWMAGVAQTMERLKLANFFGGAMNVVISNVMGPVRTKYLNGARMLTHYPVSIPAHGAAVNLTVQSYVDRLDLGVTGCLDALPDPDTLRDDIVEGWLELCHACGHADISRAVA
ncbi:MAG: wax ester/triacylglycerol synthase family O-acyltransferase [Gammaproteobacteria bacterium]|nr:wax ester/triacylglycerol synthase family O-acyltransferase [Gammaproteobacteria bacterium]